MKTIYCCAQCRSTNICRDAWVSVNDPEVSDTYDNTWCADCGYDGSHYLAFNLIDAEAEQALDEAGEAEGNKLPGSWGMGLEIFL